MTKSKCKYCQADVLIVTTTNDASTAINPMPDASGNIVMTDTGKARVLSMALLEVLAVDAMRYRAHFATCAAAAKRRR